MKWFLNTLMSILFCFDGLLFHLTSIWVYTFISYRQGRFWNQYLHFHNKEAFLWSLVLQPVWIEWLGWPWSLASKQEYPHMMEIQETGPLSQAVLPVVLRKCCCSQLKLIFLWLHPDHQSMWHRPDFFLEQPCHDNMSDGHVCLLTGVSVLCYFRPEFSITVSLKGALSRSVMNYEFHEVFDNTELFDWIFKPFPKLLSDICCIKHPSNLALEHVSSWHDGSSV